MGNLGTAAGLAGMNSSMGGSNYAMYGALGPPGPSMSPNTVQQQLAQPVASSPNNFVTSGGGAAAGNPATSIAARQQQLQQQQRELERCQRELEIQRQQLIASMQDRNYMMSSSSLPSQQPYSASYNAMGAPMAMAGGPGSSAAMNSLALSRGSLGLGSFSRGSLGLGSISAAIGSGAGGGTASQRESLGLGSLRSAHGRESLGLGPVRSSAASLDASHRSAASSSAASQWWICQVCNAKAFSSHDEAMAHEAQCQANVRKSQQQQLDQLNAMNSAAGTGGYGDGSVAARTFSLGMDSSNRSGYEATPSTLSNGPFANMESPMPLAMVSDKDWLTPLHCFVRRHCVEVFTASQEDVATPSKGKRKPITVGQVGIRCPHCHKESSNVALKGRERGSVYYPTSISSIYNATMNLLQRHLHSCAAVPDDIMRRYETLKADDARSGTSKRYWIESALSLGLVDAAMGIRFSALRPPALPTLTSPQEEGHKAVRRNSNDFFSTNSNAVLDMKESQQAGGDGGDDIDESGKALATDGGGTSEHDLTQSAPLVTPEDQPYATAFSYHLLSQMQPCVFTEADRLGKRKGLPPGFPGLACRHCFGGYGSGRFFPSSIKTLSDTSKTLNVLHNHMMRCRKCPAEVRESLEGLRGTHDEERAKMKFGSQKAFFGRIWDRLHGKGAPPVAGKRKAAGGSHAAAGGNRAMSAALKQQQQQQQLPPQTSMAAAVDAMTAAAAADGKRPKIH